MLSGSTQAYDSPSETLCERAEKFKAYRTISSFQEYILIDQTSVAIDQSFKTANKRWSLYEYDHEETELNLKSFDFKISLADLYDKVEFPAEKEESDRPL